MPKPSSLQFLGGPLGGRRLEFHGADVVLGSAVDCAVRIDAPGVAPHHARILIEITGATIYRVDGVVGVNDDLVTTDALLRSGDFVWIGEPAGASSLMLQFTLGDVEEAKAEPAPVPVVVETPSEIVVEEESENLASASEVVEEVVEEEVLEESLLETGSAEAKTPLGTEEPALELRAEPLDDAEAEAVEVVEEIVQEADEIVQAPMPAEADELDTETDRIVAMLPAEAESTQMLDARWLSASASGSAPSFTHAGGPQSVPTVPLAVVPQETAESTILLSLAAAPPPVIPAFIATSGSPPVPQVTPPLSPPPLPPPLPPVEKRQSPDWTPKGKKRPAERETVQRSPPPPPRPPAVPRVEAPPEEPEAVPPPLPPPPPRVKVTPLMVVGGLAAVAVVGVVLVVLLVPAREPEAPTPTPTPRPIVLPTLPTGVPVVSAPTPTPTPPADGEPTPDPLEQFLPPPGAGGVAPAPTIAAGATPIPAGPSGPAPAPTTAVASAPTPPPAPTVAAASGGPLDFVTGQTQIDGGSPQEFSGRFEFEVVPSPLRVGAPFRMRIYMRNEGKKDAKLTSMTVRITTNGEVSPEETRIIEDDVRVGQRPMITEIPTRGSGRSLRSTAVTSWVMEVEARSAKGERFSSTLTMRLP